MVFKRRCCYKYIIQFSLVAGSNFALLFALPEFTFFFQTQWHGVRALCSLEFMLSALHAISFYYGFGKSWGGKWRKRANCINVRHMSRVVKGNISETS
jgi:hypothetical protein